VERIISDLKAQRRCRSVSSKTSRSYKDEAPVAPIRSGSPRLERKASRHSSSGQSFGDTSGGGDELLPDKERNPSAEAVSQSFQDQVLEELRKLKEAQRMEFEALERLQREKAEAERKAHRLEQKLREQQRRLSRKDGKTRNLEEGRTTKSREDILLQEDAGSDEDNNELYPRAYGNDVGAGDSFDRGDSGTEEEDAEPLGWDDTAKSPPPYFTTASPAVRCTRYSVHCECSYPWFPCSDFPLQTLRLAGMDW
jgi:hypothetical protein